MFLGFLNYACDSLIAKSDQASAILVFLVVYFKRFQILMFVEHSFSENQVLLKI